MDASFRGIPVPFVVPVIGFVLAVVGVVWMRRIATGDGEVHSSRALAPTPRDLLAAAGVIAVVVLMATVFVITR